MDIFEKAYQFLQDEGIAARRHIELKQYTTLHIGGEAQILAEPSQYYTDSAMSGSMQTAPHRMVSAW
ncbi:MAG: hypothetical protein ACLRS2_13405 [[Clostridium] innocuum]